MVQLSHEGSYEFFRSLFTIPRRARRASRGLPTSYAAAPLNRLIMRNIPLHLDQRRGATQPLPELSQSYQSQASESFAN